MTVRDLLAGMVARLVGRRPRPTPPADKYAAEVRLWRPSIVLRAGLEKTYRWFSERWVREAEDAGELAAAAGSPSAAEPMRL